MHLQLQEERDGTAGVFVAGTDLGAESCGICDAFRRSGRPENGGSQEGGHAGRQPPPPEDPTAHGGGISGRGDFETRGKGR